MGVRPDGLLMSSVTALLGLLVWEGRSLVHLLIGVSHTLPSQGSWSDCSSSSL